MILLPLSTIVHVVSLTLHITVGTEPTKSPENGVENCNFLLFILGLISGLVESVYLEVTARVEF